MTDPQDERIAALEAELAAVRADVQEFTYTVSHDLRAQLRHILAYAEIVQEDAGPQLDAEVQSWCDELNKRSPTAIALAKKSFNADTESIRGMGQLAMQALRLYYYTEESQEGVKALNEKREPDFMKFYR